MADKLVRVMVSADTAQALRSFGELSVAANGVADEGAASMDKMASSGGKLTQLGEKLGSWGVPFSGSITNVGKKFDDADSSAGKFGALMPMIGVAVGAAVIGIGAASLDMADKFDKATNQLAANAGISQAAAKGIGDAFLNTAGTSIFTGTTITKEYAGVAAQLDATQGKALTSGQAMTVMRAAMDGATATGESLGSVTSALANTMQAFGVKANGAAGTMNTLYEAGVISGTGITGVASAVSKMHSQLGDLTPPLGQIAGLLDDLKEHGETGRQGLTAVTTGITSLIKTAQLTPTAIGAMTGAAAQNESEFQSLGLNVFNAQGKFEGIGAVMAQLKPKLDGMTQAQQLQTLGVVFGTSANKKLLDTIMAGPGVLQKDTDAVTNTGLAHAAAQKAMQNMGDQMKIIGATVDDVGTKIGEVLMPVLVRIATSIVPIISHTADWVENLRGLWSGLGDVVTGIGNVVGAFVGFVAKIPTPVLIGLAGVIMATLIPTLVSLAISTATTAGAMVAGWATAAAGAVASGVTAAVAWVPAQLGAIGAAVAAAASWAIATAAMVIGAVGAGIAMAAAFLLPLAPFILIGLAVAGLVALVVLNFGKIKTFVSGVVSDITGFFTTAWGDVTSGVSGMIDKVEGFFEQLPGKVTAVWSTITSGVGGFISGIVSFFASLPAKIGQAISGMAGILGNAIKSTINNIPGAGAIAKVLGFAGGGYVTQPTLALIGDAGPEYVIPQQLLTTSFARAQSLPAIASTSAAGGAGGAGGPGGAGAGGGVYNITVNAGIGSAPQEIVNQLKIYMQNTGTIPIRVTG